MSLKVVENVIVDDGRIHEVFKRAFSVWCENEATWGSVFNTKNYQRRRLHFEKLTKHGHWLIGRELRAAGLDWFDWRIHRRGSNRRSAVVAGTDQYYEIVKVR